MLIIVILKLYVFIVILKCITITIKTHSHGNTGDRNSLVNKVSTNDFEKFIHVFNSLNHRHRI